MKIVLDPRYWNPRGEGIGPLRKLDPRDPGCEFDRRCKNEKKSVILVHTYFQNVVSGLENHTKCLKIQYFTDIKNSNVKQLWDGEIFVL